MSKTKVKETNFITILGWMISELGLKGNQLLIYAIIYGFSQTDGQVYNGSRQYLADWTNSTTRGVTKNINLLLEKEYIEKQENIVNGVRFCEYVACVPKFTSGEQSSLGVGTKFPRGGEQSSPNNIDIYNSDNIFKKYAKENEELYKTLLEFKTMRKTIKKPMTDKAKEMLLTRLDKLSKGDSSLKIEILNQSIYKNYQDIYQISDKSTSGEGGRF